MCDAPLGFVQTDIPNTVHSFDRMIHLQNNISDDTENADEYIDIQYKTQTKRVKPNLISLKKLQAISLSTLSGKKFLK